MTKRLYQRTLIFNEDEDSLKNKSLPMIDEYLSSQIIYWDEKLRFLCTIVWLKASE